LQVPPPERISVLSLLFEKPTMSRKSVHTDFPAAYSRNPRPPSSKCDAGVIAFIGLGRFTRLVGLDLGHLLRNAALGFQRVIGVLESQKITFGQAEKFA
jgi:hypothetical protein